MYHNVFSSSLTGEQLFFQCFVYFTLKSWDFMHVFFSGLKSNFGMGLAK